MTTTSLRIPSFPTEITAESKDLFWKQVSDLRKLGWKPSEEEKLGLDEAYKAFGKALGLTRKPKASSEVKKVLRTQKKADKAFRKGAPVEVVWVAKVGTATHEVLRTKHPSMAALAAEMPRTTARLLKEAEAHGLHGVEIQTTIKHHHLQEKVVGNWAVLKRTEKAHKPTESAVNAAKQKAATVLAPKGRDPVKAALKAALQGLNATQTAIAAALEAL